MRHWTLITSTILAAMTSMTPATAQTTQQLRVLASNGMKAVIEELRPKLQREVGRPLVIEFNTSAATRQRIESGESFDVAILTSEVVNDLAKAGRITSSSVVDLGRSGIGIGVRSGAAKPAIQTPEDVKQALLKAKSLTWVGAGASRVHIDRMLDALGIANEVRTKTALTQGVDESSARVAEGQSEMIVTLISEILPAKGVQLVGPLPQKFQNYVTFAGGVNPKSSIPAASALFIKVLAEPAAAKTYEKKGMELPAVASLRRSLTK
jgi:molybdate transport system substrate-binding protein